MVIFPGAFRKAAYRVHTIVRGDFSLVVKGTISTRDPIIFCRITSNGLCYFANH